MQAQYLPSCYQRVRRRRGRSSVRCKLDRYRVCRLSGDTVDEVLSDGVSG